MGGTYSAPVFRPVMSFEILATGRSDVHCKIKETLLIKDLKPALNENVGSEKQQTLDRSVYYHFF